MINKLSEIVTAAKAKGRKRIVVAHAQDAHTLEAVSDAHLAGLVDVTLIGSPSEIAEICKADGIDSSDFEIIESGSDVESVEKAVHMVSSGKGDVLMKGIVSTDKYMRGILNKEYGLLPAGGVLSHVTVFEIPAYHKLLVGADVAVIPYPTMEQKRAMISYLANTARVLGIERPKVAAIAPSEQLLPKVQSSVDAAQIGEMGRRGEFGDAIVDGPLALDIAIDAEAAKIKKIDSPVAGDADCLLFANIDAANVFFKAATKLAGGELAAMVAGTNAPCVLTSRSDSRNTKLYSIALACLSAK